MELKYFIFPDYLKTMLDMINLLKDYFILDYFQIKMSIEDWKNVVSLAATISTVVNFLTGLQVRIR